MSTKKNTDGQSDSVVYDLSQLDTAKASDEGAELELRHPKTGEVLGGPVIILAGPDSEIVRGAQRKLTNKRLKGRRTKVDAEMIEDEQLEVLALSTLGWRDIACDGAVLPCSKENAKMLYGRFPWIREQVDEFVGERGNFIKSS
jgi:hypothetical protein